MGCCTQVVLSDKVTWFRHSQLPRSSQNYAQEQDFVRSHITDMNSVVNVRNSGLHYFVPKQP